MKFLNNEKYHLPILIIICFVLFFWKITAIPLTDGDSAFYAKIAKNIVETGDWMTMHYGDAGTIINKPPLMMWLTAASFKLFGINDFAVSFWHAGLALLIVLFTFKLAKELFGSRTAFISAMVLATSTQFFYQARSPLQDIPLTLFVLLSIYSFILFEKRGGLIYFYLSPIFVSLAVLSKGPVGLVLPASIILIYILINKTKLPAVPHILGGIFLLLALTLPWFIIEYRILGQPFLDTFIGSNIGRYLKPIDTIGDETTKFSAIKPQYDFYSYFLQIFLMFIPWSGFVYPAFYYAYRKKMVILPLIFALAIVIFFSLSLNYKISRYILPAFPAIAIVVGKMLTDLIDGDTLARKMALVSAFFTLVVVAVPLLVLTYVLYYIKFSQVSGDYAPILFSFLVPLISCLVLGPILIFFKRHRTSFITMLCLIILSYVLFIYSLASHYPNIAPVKRFCDKINGSAKASDIIVQYGGTDAHFMIYYSKYNVMLVREAGTLKMLLDSGKKVFCVADNASSDDPFITSLKGRIKLLDKGPNSLLFSN